MMVRRIGLIGIGLACLAACQGAPTEPPTTQPSTLVRPKAKGTASPSPSASTAVTPKPSSSPSTAASVSPSPSPSASPSASPSVSPSPSPSASASASPSPSPSPSASAGPDFFPIAEGARRVFDTYDNGVKIGTNTTRIGALTIDAGVTSYTLVAVSELTTGQRDVFKTTYKRSATLVESADEGSTDFRTKLKFPVQVGTTWTTPDGDSFEITEGPVTVTVPYGTVNGAFKIVHKMNTTVLDTTWYAPDLGEVKTEGGTFKSELKEYTASGTAALDETVVPAP